MNNYERIKNMTLDEMAGLKGVSSEAVERVTAENAIRLYRLPVSDNK